MTQSAAASGDKSIPVIIINLGVLVAATLIAGGLGLDQTTSALLVAGAEAVSAIATIYVLKGREGNTGARAIAAAFVFAAAVLFIDTLAGLIGGVLGNEIFAWVLVVLAVVAVGFAASILAGYTQPHPYGYALLGVALAFAARLVIVFVIARAYLEDIGAQLGIDLIGTVIVGIFIFYGLAVIAALIGARLGKKA